jgi:cell division inhibitor SulA
MLAMQANSAIAIGADTTSRISEFIFPGDPRQQLPLILPMLSHLSHCGDSRWLMCVGASFLSKKDCLDFALDWRRLLQVLPSARCDVFELTARALAAGKSHTLICMAPVEASPQQIALLEQAARSGNCRCILIRGR